MIGRRSTLLLLLRRMQGGRRPLSTTTSTSTSDTAAAAAAAASANANATTAASAMEGALRGKSRKELAVFHPLLRTAQVRTGKRDRAPVRAMSYACAVNQTSPSRACKSDAAPLTLDPI